MKPINMKQAKSFKSTQSNVSWNNEVRIIKYNKYNQNLLSPPKLDNEESSSRMQGLKVAKKRLQRRQTSQIPNVTEQDARLEE